ncbi:hypothetical protein ACT691_20545 [Vibrio metschnikovii]
MIRGNSRHYDYVGSAEPNDQRCDNHTCADPVDAMIHTAQRVWLWRATGKWKSLLLQWSPELVPSMSNGAHESVLALTPAGTVIRQLAVARTQDKILKFERLLPRPCR